MPNSNNNYWSWRSINRLIVLKIIARLPASAKTRHLHRPRQPRGQRFGEKNSEEAVLGADLAHGGTNSGPLEARFGRYSDRKVPAKSWVGIILHIVLVLLAYSWPPSTIAPRGGASRRAFIRARASHGQWIERKLYGQLYPSCRFRFPWWMGIEIRALTNFKTAQLYLHSGTYLDKMLMETKLCYIG